MASAGTVTLQLDADSVKLLRELQKSQRATKRTAGKMRKSMTNAFKGIRRSILSAGTAMAAFVAGRGISRMATEIDKIGKTVDRLGGSTEAFSELQFVAERSGLAFNTLTMGLQRMQRRVAEAANGFGEAKDALRELRIDAGALNRLPIDKQFEAIADALAKVATDGDRTRLAMKLFDSEGVALLQTMKNGAAGIRGLRQEAQRLGVSLGRDQVQAATDAKDAMTNLSASARALGISLTSALAPALTTVFNKMQLLIGGNSPAAELALEMDQIRERLELLGNKPIHAVEIKALIERFGDLAKQIQAIENPIVDAGVALEELQEIIVTTAMKTDIYAQDLAAFSNKFQTAEMRAEALRKTLQRFQSDLNPEQIAKINQEINEILTGGIEEINTGPIQRMKKVTKTATDEMSEYAKQAARNMQDAFADFLFDPFQDGLDGMLKSFLDTMRRMLANQLAASFFNATGLGSLFGGARAMGGPVSAGTPYLVGERGPELFVPGQSGNVVANDKMGGANITYNIDARGADEAAVVARMIPLLERTVQVTKEEIRKDKREGRF